MPYRAVTVLVVTYGPGQVAGSASANSAPCGDPSVWFLTELLHACSGQRPG